MDYTKINAKTIDEWVEDGWQWGIPLSQEEFGKAKEGQWEMVLTPTKPVPKEWFPHDLKGKKVLGLASGGGQQMPIFAALGAECTVLDYATKQIESEKMVAEREGYQMEMIQADMTQALPFEDESFDLIFHPVSNVYVEDVLSIWKECYRVLKPGGRLLSGLDNGINFLFDPENEATIKYSLPFNPLKNPEQLKMLEATHSGIQFSHTIEDQIRGQLQVGFRLQDIYEDTNGEGFLHEQGIPSFWASLAIKE